MLKKTVLYALLFTFMLALAACGGQTAETQPAATTQPTTQSDDEMMDGDNADDEMMDDSQVDDSQVDDSQVDDDHADDEMMDDDAAMMEDAMAMTDLPAWQTVALVDAHTGTSYTLADLHGKTVFVEPMATWCTNCRRQLGDVNLARQALEGEAVVFVALSVETTIKNDDLASYADNNDWPFTFSVLTQESLNLLVDEFGQSFANPPSTPHFIIRPDGSFTELDTGFESPEELIAQIQAAMQ